METENLELRRHLDDITTRYINDDVGDQIDAIAELNNRCTHSIRLYQEAIPDEPETFQFTCIQHALDLVGSRLVNRIAGTYTDIYPSAEFVQYLLRNNLTEVAEADVEDCDLIVYARRGEIQHVGKVIGERVLSKWGLMHLWSHAPYEVPARYGSEIGYYRRIRRAECLAAFEKYARNIIRRDHGESGAT